MFFHPTYFFLKFLKNSIFFHFFFLNLPSSFFLIMKLVDLETRFKTVLTRLQYSEADYKVCDEKKQQLDQQKVLKEKSIKSIRKEIEGLKKEVSILYLSYFIYLFLSFTVFLFSSKFFRESIFFHFMTFYLILSYLSYFILFYLILSYFILFYLIFLGSFSFILFNFISFYYFFQFYLVKSFRRSSEGTSTTHEGGMNIDFSHFFPLITLNYFFIWLLLFFLWFYPNFPRLFLIF